MFDPGRVCIVFREELKRFIELARLGGGERLRIEMLENKTGSPYISDRGRASTHRDLGQQGLGDLLAERRPWNRERQGRGGGGPTGCGDASRAGLLYG